jgi:DNA-binding transcriptional regulator YhcF (GntR family)
MSAKYWIKLYHEILDDPKMGMLPDNVYRRCIEIFLLAGRLDDEGQLPCTTELCWMLRQRPDTFEPELKHLENVGILTRTKTGWVVTNFRKRQAAVTDAGRMKEYRKRLKKSENAVTKPLQDSYNSVTIRNTDTDTDTDITTTIGAQSQKSTLDQIGLLCKLHFSDPSIEPFKSQLIEVINTNTAEKVLDAILIAISPERQNGKPKTWGYVLGILKNGNDKPKGTYKNGHNKPDTRPEFEKRIQAGKPITAEEFKRQLTGG